ncbi:MAG: hypothetical protein JO333_05305 [Verrucomicrobia bacterium]|nr:hypothetical protein [Verrucomicrobiota bacterium]
MKSRARSWPDRLSRRSRRFPSFPLVHLAIGRQHQHAASNMKLSILCCLLFGPFLLRAQESSDDGKILLTVILHYNETKTLDEIDAHLAKTGFLKNFPPDGVEIVSYHIVMGLGHVITLRLPPEKLREVNLAFEKGVWGAFRTEFFPTYDYMNIFNDLKQRAPAPEEPNATAAPSTPSPTPTPAPKRPYRRRHSE